jgi:membrane protease YdiL (CAAX protease family)
LTEPAPGAPAGEPPSSRDGAAAPRPDASGSAPPAPPRAPGLFRFSLEGRQAPGLFVGGWLPTIVGGGLIAIVFLNGGGASGALLVLGLALLSVGFVVLGGSQAIERRAAGEPYAGPSPVVLFLAIVAITLLVAGLLDFVLTSLGVEVERPVGDLIAVTVQGLIFVGVVRLMVVAPGALSWSDMGFTRDRRRIVGMLGLGAVFALPTIFLTGLVASVLVPLLGQAPPSPLPPTGTAAGLGLHLVAGAGIAPFAEEVVFRGAALTAWLRTVGPTGAIVRSAILFSAAHALGIGGETFGQAFGLAVVATAARLPVALALGWIYVRTGSIWASIGLHSAFNAILIVVSELGLASPAAFLGW